MMTRTKTTATAGRSNRVLVILAAAWMALAIAIGGAAVDGPTAQQAKPPAAADGAAAP
jgi:hypothetical protein